MFELRVDFNVSHPAGGRTVINLADIQEGDCKDDTGKLRRWNDRQYKYIESKMDFDEHRRILFDALQQLLPGDMKKAKNAAEEKLERLKEAYDSQNAHFPLRIAKGIHQPASDPHMRLELQFGTRVIGGIHLNVAASNVRGQHPGLTPETYFHWEGVQFAAECEKKLRAYWPKGDQSRDMKNAPTRRKMSIAPGDIQNEINRIIAREQAEQLAQQQAQQRQQDQEHRENIKRQLKGANFTIEGVREGLVPIRFLDTLMNGGEVKGTVPEKKNPNKKAKYDKLTKKVNIS
jgi:hypothetical protein